MPTMNESLESPTVQFRSFTMADMNDVIQLRLLSRQTEPHLFPRSYQEEAATSKEQWLERFEQTQGEHPTRLLELAWSGKQLVGMAGAVEKERGVWELHGVYVRPEVRGQKIAPRLVQRLVGTIRGRGARRMQFQAVAANTVAVRMYEDLGFRIVGSGEEIMGDGKAHAKVVFAMDF